MKLFLHIYYAESARKLRTRSTSSSPDSMTYSASRERETRLNERDAAIELAALVLDNQISSAYAAAKYHLKNNASPAQINNLRSKITNQVEKFRSAYHDDEWRGLLPSADDE